MTPDSEVGPGDHRPPADHVEEPPEQQRTEEVPDGEGDQVVADRCRRDTL